MACEKKSKCCSNKKTALIILTEGAEDVEVAVPVDVLRRAGVLVTVAGFDGATPVKCSNGLIVIPDDTFCVALKKGPYDAIILPGGPGHKTLCKSPEIGSILKQQEDSGRIIAAICAAPAILVAHEIALGRYVTSHPSVKCQFSGCGYKYKEDNVVEDENIITSRGPGTAFEFALTLAAKLVGKCPVLAVAETILVPYEL